LPAPASPASSRGWRAARELRHPAASLFRAAAGSSSGHSCPRPTALGLAALGLLSPPRISAQVAVLTQNNGNAWTGANTAEAALTPAGGIWQASKGLAADAAGFLYCSVGNGTFDANVGGLDYGMFGSGFLLDSANLGHSTTTTDSSGTVTIAFSTVKDNAKVSGIEPLH